MSQGINILDIANQGNLLDVYKKKFNVETDQELQQKLKRAYYEGTALVSDETYDRLFPVDPLGYQVLATIWPKFTHKVDSIGMPKYKKLEDAENYISLNNYSLQVIEHKLDGINMKLYYEHGQLTHAVTRGSGIEGEDILPNAINFKQVPQTIPSKSSMVVVEGEIVMNKVDFDTINSEYSNRRNAVAGIARRLDGNYSNLLAFYAYTLYEPVNGKLERYATLDSRQKLQQYGFKIPENLLSSGKSLAEIYKDAGDVRDTNREYIIDGLVLKARENQFALKFPANTGETTVVGYRWELGNTYRLIPVVLYETINIGGANYSKASLASAQNFVKTNAPVGSTIEIARANEVIPYLKSVVARSDEPLDVPINCPVCGAPLEWKGAHLVCNNENCKSRIFSKCQRLIAILDIRGFKMTTICKLIDLGIITTPSQILTLTPDQIEKSGKSSKVALKMAQAIHNRLKELDDAAIVFALELPGISLASIRELDKAAAAKGKTLFQVVELQEQDDYTTIQQVLKNVKADALIKYMTSPAGRTYYSTIKSLILATHN